MAHPPFTLIYGDLKTGKTCAVLAAYPTSRYVAAPGALGPAQSVWGFDEPKAIDLETFKDVTEYASKLKPGETAGLVVDDVTLIADRTVAKYQKTKDGFDLWGAIFDDAIELRDALRRINTHCVFTCHAVPAEVKQGVRLRGGPAFPGQTRKKLPAAVDLLLRVEPRAAVFGEASPFGWPYALRTLMDGDWLAGSRYNTPDYAPLNLREVLGLAGFRLPRVRGLEWQEVIAEKIAGQLVGLDEEGTPKVADVDFCRKLWDACRRSCKGRDERHIEWAIADGYDRAILRIAAQAYRRRLFT